MIETFRAANGEVAFSFNGRLLCSKVAPAKEAATFVAKWAAQIERSRTIFLLGLGGGHVVEAIRQRYADKNIVVIETESEIIDTVSCAFSFSLLNVEIVRVNSIDDLKVQRAVLTALHSSYCVLNQACTQWLNPDFYAAATNLLIGRSAEAFAFLLTTREDVRDALRPLVEINGLASIKTLTQNLATTTNSEKAKVKLLIKTLRELVI